MESRGETTESARAVLVGWPNVGKSSLFNALAGRDAAIVSHVAGTTRDYLTAKLDLDGIACELIDTAGVELDVRPEGIRQAAQASTAEQWRQAHVELFCLDATRDPNAWEREQLARTTAGQRLIVWTKTDLPDCRAGGDENVCLTSSISGAGLAELRERLRAAIVESGASDCQVVAATAERSRESLRLAAECLERARQTVTAGGGEELIAAEVRTALSALGDVVGAVYTDDILDRIFSRFCIGK